MTSKTPEMLTDTALIKAMEGVLLDIENDLKLTAPLDAYLAGGMAVYLYTANRVTTDIDLEFNRRKVALTRNFTREAVLDDGSREEVFLDTNYSNTYAMLHEDYQDDALPVKTSLKFLRLKVLTPVDLAVSKIARFAGQDQEDIRALAAAGLFTSQELRARAEEAVANYVGNHDSLRTSINLAVKLVEGVEALNAPLVVPPSPPGGGSNGGSGTRLRI